MALKILVSAGELSGDEHAARIVRHLPAGTQLFGMGGSNLKEAGMELLVDNEVSGSVMGFMELLPKSRQIISAFQTLTRVAADRKPDLAILIDYPDFNLRLAKKLKQQGVKVLYFIPPKMWVWRAKRVEQFHKYVDQVACIFPFETKFFEQNSYKYARFIGHPIAYMKSTIGDNDVREMRAFVGASSITKLLTIFPGSRSAELRRHLPILKGAIKKILIENSTVTILIARASNVSHEELESALGKQHRLKFVSVDALTLFRISDAALVKSGTSNLQAALSDIPFAMFYKASPVSAFIARRVVKIPEYSIVNLLKPGTIREYLQEEMTVENLCKEATSLLLDEKYRVALKKNLESIRANLLGFDDDSRFDGTGSPYERVARMVESMVVKG